MSLRVLCPVRWQVTTLDCVLLKNRSLVFVVGLGPKISFFILSLEADRTPPHCQMLVVCPAFYSSSLILLSNILWNRSVSCELVRNFILSYPNTYVQGPKTAPQCGRWKCHSTSLGTVIPMEMFWQPEVLSDVPDCQCKY
jgi:hypothetical protein